MNDFDIKPFIKWAGGKRQLLPEIKKHLPENINDYTYYEPFVGAGAVFLELKPKKALINDVNKQLIIAYKAIKEDVESLIKLLETHKKMNCAAYYYQVRNLDRDAEQFNSFTNIEKAARLIYLNKTCYNGLYRVNSSGFFNVPFGKYKNPSICDETLLRRISDYFNSNEIEIRNEDFESAVAGADINAFVYFDPPYHSPDKTNFTGYQADGFNESEQERLARLMIQLTKRGMKCLLSNSDTEFIRKLYNAGCFTIVPVQAKRAINSDSSGRGAVNEVLIKNW